MTRTKGGARLRAGAFAACVVALAAVARADAPATQYDLFNSQDVVIHDLKTGLTWERSVSADPSLLGGGLDAATTYCASLALGGASWRVPSYKELLTLVDESPHTEYEDGALVAKAIDQGAFPGTPVDHPYWSSSPDLKQQSGYVYTVSFGDGLALPSLATDSRYVRCVHD